MDGQIDRWRKLVDPLATCDVFSGQGKAIAQVVHEIASPRRRQERPSATKLRAKPV
jgi:hypothetical protein